MLDIGEHIYHLLNFHQKIVLSGIGLFKKQRIPAIYDENTSRFLPPGFVVTLQTNDYGEDDEVLLHYVSKKHQITPEEAQKDIDAAVSNLLTELATKGTAKIDPLGTFQRKNDTLAFSSERLGWGLKAMQERYNTTVYETNPPAEEVEAIPVIATTEPTFDAAVEEADGFRKKRKTSWVWVAAVGLVLVASSFFIWKYYQKKTTLITTGPAAKVTTTGSLLQDTSRMMPTSVAQDSILKDTLASDTVLADSSKNQPVSASTSGLIKKASETKGYTIVVGSFKAMGLAIKQAKYFRSIGIDVFVQDSRMPQNRKKVCYGIYPTKEAASKDLQKIRQEINPEAYIYP